MNRFSTQQNGMTNSFFFNLAFIAFGKELFICIYIYIYIYIFVCLFFIAFLIIKYKKLHVEVVRNMPNYVFQKDAAE